MAISRKRIYQASLNNPENRLATHNEDSNLSVSSSGAEKKKDGHDDEEEEIEEGEESANDSDTAMDDLNDHVRGSEC